MRYALVLAVFVSMCVLPAWALTVEQEAKLLASDGAAADHFGYGIALDGDTAIIGAYWDDDNGEDSGSAYVFTRTGSVWTEQTKLLPADGAAWDRFGYSVALDGNTAVVGAFEDADNGEESGSAYVFIHMGGTWTQQIKLLPADGADGDQFGRSVALDGDTAIIGAPNDDDNGEESGSAYVFTRTAGVWTEQATLLASDGAAGDWFGFAVALDGDTAIIGAPDDDDNGVDSGSAYVFTRTGGVWTEQAKILAADGAAWDRFGFSVALDGNTALIGAYSDNDNGVDSGSAYVFTRTGGVWTEQAKLLPAYGAAEECFGVSVALDGNTALIGAYLDRDNGPHSGSAYVFTRAGGVWTEQATLLASDGAEYDYFGRGVALSGNTAVIGATCDDDNGEDSGSAYVFRLYDDDVPATTYRGMAVMALLLLVASTAFLLRRRATH